MKKKRRVCLAIGIENAGAGLDLLPDAPRSAGEFASWAHRSKFDAVSLLVDAGPPADAADNLRIEIGPVTKEVVGNALRALLPSSKKTDTLVLYFAGHGLRRGINQGLWLLSDWKKSDEGAATDVLLGRLGTYGIANVALFSDSCRALPQNMNELQLVGNFPLEPGPNDPAKFKVSQFFAVGDGSSAFMVGKGAEARCVFSGALMEALWGGHDDLYNRDDEMDGEQLGLYLEKRAPAIGRAYRVKCEPDLHVDIPRNHIVYSRREDRPPDHSLRPWPERPPALAAAPPRSHGTEAGFAAWQQIRRTPLGRSLGRRNPSIDSDAEFSIPDTAFPSIETLDDILRRSDVDFIPVPDEPAADDLALDYIRNEAKGAAIGQYRKRLAVDTVVVELERVVAEHEDEQRRGAIVERLLRVRPPETLRNLVVLGRRVAAIWVPRLEMEIRHDSNQGDQIDYLVEARDHDERKELQIAVEFDNGECAPVTLMEGLEAVLAYDDDRVTGLYYRPQPGWSADEKGDRMVVRRTIDAVARMESGRLSPAEIDRLATDLRFNKHSNPMLGVIAAYLYASVGDLDSIRRTAWFYPHYGQAIPFDLAFLGGMKIGSDPERPGSLLAEIPATPARKGSKKGLPEWATRATPANRGRLAGRCPWLRQGWDRFDESTSPGMAAIRRRLRPSAFPLIDRKGGERFAARFGLERIA